MMTEPMDLGENAHNNPFILPQEGDTFLNTDYNVQLMFIDGKWKAIQGYPTILYADDRAEA